MLLNRLKSWLLCKLFGHGWRWFRLLHDHKLVDAYICRSCGAVERIGGER